MSIKARPLGRALALKALYEADTSSHPVEEALEGLLTREQDDEALATTTPRTEDGSPEDAPVESRVRIPARDRAAAAGFARTLVQGVQENREAIDAVIGQAAPQWPVSEVAVVDRNVLRVAIFEMLFDNETPVPVAVNEAVELAKRFGSESSPRFVNGVLGAVAARVQR